MGVFEPVKAVLELAREASKHVEAWRQRRRHILPDPTPKLNSYLPFETKQASSAMTTSDVTYKYLRKTRQEICRSIPSSSRILHVEEVIRGDLAQAFHRRQEKMRRTLSARSYNQLREHFPVELRHSSRRKEDYVEHLVTPRITFHGTQRQNVGSIVRHGFLKPGAPVPGTKAAGQQQQHHEVRYRSTYGRGVYSAPSADFALSYVDSMCRQTRADEFFGLKLVVCATLS